MSVRSHQNRGGYCGVRVAVGPLLEEIRSAAETRGWTVRDLIQQGRFPVRQLTKPAVSSTTSPRRIYISAGIHGDEPAGPMAAIQMIRDDQWSEGVEVCMFPCLNPAGLAENRREGLEKIDFNRDYRQPATSLIRAHVAWLESQPRFDLAVLLHEDWEADGFYVYALGQDERAGQIVGAVSKVCPILQADRADDWPALSGVVRPSEKRINRPDWPEALYLFRKKTEVCYTLEAPSDYDLSTRVTALTTGVRAAMEFAEREAD